MKLSQKLAIALFAATTGVMGLSSGAIAGEGGAAGAAAFTIGGTNNVTGVAVAASVGKNDASAAAYNYSAGTVGTAAVQNSAYALGSAGFIDIDYMGDPDNAYMMGAVDSALITQQANLLNSTATIQLGTEGGNAIVTIPD